MKDSLRRLFTSVLAPGGGGLPSYSSILIDTYGAHVVFPLVDIASGTTITAKTDSAYNGALVGWTLQNAAGPVTNTLAPYSDGTSDYGAVDTVALRAAWNGGIGSCVMFGQVSAVGDWTDTVTRELFSWKVDNNNWIRAYKHGTLGLDAYVALGGNASIRRQTTATTAWFMVGISWQDSANGNAVKAYFNGTQVGTTVTGYGAWAGTPVTLALGSAADNGASAVWKGWLGYAAFKFGSVWSATDMANIYAARLEAGPENP